MNMELLTDLLVLSAVIPIGLFVYFYGTRAVKGSRWKRRLSKLWRTTQVGRTLMYQMMAWLVYLIFIISSLWMPQFEGRSIIRVVLYVALVTMFWRLFFNLRAVQKQDKSDERAKGLNLDGDTENTGPHRPIKK